MKLHEALNVDLELVNEALVHAVTSDPDLAPDSIIPDNVIRLIRAGGKRLRPLLVIVGSRFGPAPCPDKTLKAAVTLEYLHMASLVHDDIIDGSGLRRGEPTVHMRTGIPAAVRVANYMLARAVEWAAEAYREEAEARADDRSQTSRGATVHNIITRLCLGEYQQLNHRFDFDMTLDRYLEKTNNKTAVLMASCLQAGAEAAEADEEVCGRLYDFGEALGMAFQIRDDVLDFVQSPDAIGKPAGADLRNGNVTLPVLYALEEPALAAEIRALHEGTPDEAMRRVVARIAASGAMERAMALADRYLQRAGALLEAFGGYPAQADLRVLRDRFIG